MAKLYPTSDQTSVSWGGQQFDAVDGVFDVPDEAVADLLPHGLSTAAPHVVVVETIIPTGSPAKWTTEVIQAEAERLGLDATLPRQELVKAVAQARKVEAEQIAAEAEA